MKKNTHTHTHIHIRVYVRFRGNVEGKKVSNTRNSCNRRYIIGRHSTQAIVV